MLPLSVLSLKDISLREEHLSPRNSAVFGAGDNQMVISNRWQHLNSSCVLNVEGWSSFLQERPARVEEGERDPSPFHLTSRNLSLLPFLIFLLLRLRWCEPPNGRPYTRVLSRLIIILATARQWVNTSSISSFIMTDLWPVLVGDRQHTRLPAVIISSAGNPLIEIETSFLLPRMSVFLFFLGSRSLILPPTYWAEWPRWCPGIGRGSIITPLFFWKPLLIPSGLRVPAIRPLTGFRSVLLKDEANGTPTTNIRLLLRPYFSIPWAKTSGRSLPLMTKKEAQKLYRSGEEPTVEKLLELDREVEEFKKIIKSESSQNDPSTPSGMKAPYEKPSPKGRRKRPGRSKGHKGTRRPTPEVIDKVKPHTISCCPDCLSPLENPVSTRNRFTEDIPRTKPVVTKNIINIYWCSKCKKNVEAPCEDALPKNTLGNRLLIHTAYLHFCLGLALHKVVAYLNSWSNGQNQTPLLISRKILFKKRIFLKN